MDCCVIFIGIVVIIAVTLQQGAGNTECCENGGRYDYSVRLCDCPDNYWGTYCHFRGVCTRVCENGGECDLDVAGRYRCKCQTGYHGELCESTDNDNATSSRNISAAGLLCGTPVTPTTPPTDDKSRFDMAMMIMYLIIGALIVAFIVLTVHYKREYKSIRRQQRQSLRIRLDSMRESYHSRECYDVETPPESPRQTGAVTSPSTRFKLISPAMAPPYSESPPPYDTVVISTIIEEDEEDEEYEA